MGARNTYLLKKYGITSDEYENLLLKQDGRCGVCRRHANEFKQRLAVDHDHFTGHIRGLLCNYCNRRVVGRHRRDLGADLLKAAYDYLIKEYTEWVVPKRKKKKRGKQVLRLRRQRLLRRKENVPSKTRA